MRVKNWNNAVTVSRLLKYSFGFLAGIAALAAGTAAQGPPTVRVDTGELQGVADDGVATYKGIPFAAPPRRRVAMASASTRRAVDWSAPGYRIWCGLHAGALRSATGTRCSPASTSSGAQAVGRLFIC
jgi:hypothetical protein